MKTNKSEQDFVLRYFQSGKLNTVAALRRVKDRVRESQREESQEQDAISDSQVIPISKSLRARRLRWVAVAASLLVLMAVGAYTLLMPRTVVLRTGGQVMAYDLPDGTHVTLSPFSSLSYQEDNCREVEMKGCVYYQVKHDELHPFDVVGERGHVRVLGTQFLVDERTDAPEVIVTSGKVLFTARNAQNGVFLAKGKKARLSQGADKPKLLSDYDVNDVAWATHRLHFDNTPLSEVLEDLSKLSGVKYTSSDENKRLTGDFNTDSIPQVIQIIEETLGVTIRK